MPVTAPLDRVPFESAPYHGPEHNGSATVLSDVIFGGPKLEPDRDRRLIIDLRTLRQLTEIAEQSPCQEVVIHHAGFRMRRIQDGAHVVEAIYIIGSQPKPVPFVLGSKR